MKNGLDSLMLSMHSRSTWFSRSFSAICWVDEVNVDVLGSQRLCHCWVYAVHDGVALGIHIAERAADKDFDVLIVLGHSRESIGG